MQKLDPAFAVAHVAEVQLRRLKEVRDSQVFSNYVNNPLFWSAFTEYVFRLAMLLNGSNRWTGNRYAATNDVESGLVLKGGRPVVTVADLIRYVRNVLAHSLEENGIHEGLIEESEFGVGLWGFAIGPYVPPGGIMAVQGRSVGSKYEDDIFISACNAGLYMRRHLYAAHDWCEDAYGEMLRSVNRRYGT